MNLIHIPAHTRGPVFAQRDNVSIINKKGPFEDAAVKIMSKYVTQGLEMRTDF